MNKKEQIAKKVSQTLQDLADETAFENLIKDNKIEFTLKGNAYRVRKPNLIEQGLATKARTKKYLELIEDDTCLFREQWVEKYKAKGIDIDKIEREIIQLESEVEKLLLRLAKVEDESDINLLKNEIRTLRDKQVALTMQKTDLLSYSIEDKLLYFVNTYVSYLVLEKKTQDGWKRAFDNYEDFSKSDDSILINKAFYYMNLIVYSQNEL